MSKEKKVTAVQNSHNTDVSVPPPPSTSEKEPSEKMLEVDKMALDLAKSRKETALAQAKEALAKNETADLNYKYVVLQLYMKYGLTQADAISEGGDIVRNGAIQAQAQGK